MMALDMLFADRTSAALAKCLDGVGLRQRVIADNIANVETPGFTRSEVDFEGQLKEALGSSPDVAMKRIGDVNAKVRADHMSPARSDGNNVSIDKEMAGMTKNTMQYEALIQLMNLKGSMLRSAIEGRR
jgi:flagellar basal-body rod protein FlgB